MREILKKSGFSKIGLTDKLRKDIEHSKRVINDPLKSVSHKLLAEGAMYKAVRLLAYNQRRKRYIKTDPNDWTKVIEIRRA